MPEEIRLFFTSQDDIAASLKKYVDTYLSGVIDDDSFKSTICKIAKENDALLFKSGSSEFTVRTQNILGKKRMNIVRRVMGGKE